MNINLNGKQTIVKDKTTITELLIQLKITPELVACELNLKIIKRKEYSTTLLKEKDQLEILQMIGGG